MCTSSPKVSTVAVPAPTAPVDEPTFKLSDQATSSETQRKKRLGLRQFQVSLGGTNSLSSGLGLSSK